MSRLISAKQAAEETGLPYTSLRDAAHRGLIPVVRVNRSWYFERADLDNFIRSRTEMMA
jgi:excisionase family DNA binding protein